MTVLLKHELPNYTVLHSNDVYIVSLFVLIAVMICRRNNQSCDSLICALHNRWPPCMNGDVMLALLSWMASFMLLEVLMDTDD